MSGEVVRLNRLLGKYSGEVRKLSDELLRLSEEILYHGADEQDVGETDVITILVALMDLINSAESVEQIKNNEIYDHMEEWLNANG